MILYKKKFKLPKKKNQNILFCPYSVLQGAIVKFCLKFSKRLSLEFFKVQFIQPELKTLEWDIINPDHLIGVSNVHTFDFNLNPPFWISLDYIKVTFDNNYRYNGISIELISDWIKVSCSQAGF